MNKFYIYLQELIKEAMEIASGRELTMPTVSDLKCSITEQPHMRKPLLGQFGSSLYF
jgi:hypothetical protein